MDLLTGEWNVIVIGGVIEENGRYLIAQRKRGDAYELRWEFPGGKVRPGETPEEALKRELSEELDLDVTVQEFLGAQEDSDSEGAVNILYYRVRVDSGSYTLNAHEKVQWVTLNEIDEYSLLEGDRAFVKRLTDASTE